MMIPFSRKTGNMLDYSWDTVGEDNQRTVWKENYEFDDVLEFTHFTRGRSSVKAHFKSLSDGKLYEMFITDFEKMLLAGRLDRAQVCGRFTFCKRGANYGIKVL